MKKTSIVIVIINIQLYFDKAVGNLSIIKL